MRHSIAATFVAFMVISGLVVPVRGELISVSGTLEGDSTLTPTGTPGVFIQAFTGEGDDTTFGSFSTQSTSTIDFRSPPSIIISGGMLTLTFLQGSWFGTTDGVGTASGAGTATFTVDFVLTGGTGLFAGATGEATITGMITSTGPTTETITASYVGTINLVPEPSSLAILAPTMAVAAFASARKRRSGAMARSHG